MKLYRYETDCDMFSYTYLEASSLAKAMCDKLFDIIARDNNITGTSYEFINKGKKLSFRGNTCDISPYGDVTVTFKNGQVVICYINITYITQLCYSLILNDYMV